MPCDRKHIEAIRKAWVLYKNDHHNPVPWKWERILDNSIDTALAACDESPCVWTNILGQAWDGTIEESMIPSCADRSYSPGHGFTYCPHCGRKIEEAGDA